MNPITVHWLATTSVLVVFAIGILLVAKEANRRWHDWMKPPTATRKPQTKQVVWRKTNRRIY